jgi:hypothetical protein
VLELRATPHLYHSHVALVQVWLGQDIEISLCQHSEVFNLNLDITTFDILDFGKKIVVPAAAASCQRTFKPSLSFSNDTRTVIAHVRPDLLEPNFSSLV